MDNYTKLSALVDSEFTITKVGGYQFKMWDNETKRMLTSDRYEKGYKKVYRVETNKGILDLSANQLANLLEAVQKDGASIINGRTFSVKSNGKTGMDIRYYLNAVRTPVNAPEVSSNDGFEDLPEGW